MDFFKFILIYSLLISSVIGYGLIFSAKFTKYNNYKSKDLSIGYIGLFGIVILILISYLTNLIYPHNNFHNLIFLIFGILIFLFFYLKNLYISKYFILSYLLSFFALFYFKSHDDFSYYHLSSINNITENKIEFGISYFDYAF